MGKTQQLGTLVNGFAVDANGNVGIGGAANASYKLAVTGASLFSSSVTAVSIGIKDSSVDNPSSLALFEGAQSGRGLQIGLTTDSLGATGSAVIYNARVSGGYGGHIWQNGGSAKMVLNASGNLGIGTTNPDALLRIDANVASTANNMFYLYNADFTSTTRTFIRVRNNISAGATYSSYFGQGADRKTYIIANDTSRNDLVINGDDGYIGMGTKNPSSKLTIIRNSPFNTGDQALRIRATDSDGYNLWMGASTNGYATIQSYRDEFGGAPLLLNPLNGGNVLVGGTTDNGFKLDVSGRARANAFTSSTGSTGSVNSGTSYGIINVTTKGIYYIFAQLPAGTGDVTNYTSMVIVLADGSAAKIVANYSAPLLPITLSGTLISVAQNSGATQPSIVWNFVAQN